MLRQLINWPIGINVLSFFFFFSFDVHFYTFPAAMTFHKNDMHARSLSNLARDGWSASDISRELYYTDIQHQAHSDIL